MPTPENLNVPAREAVEFFRSKGYHVASSWLVTEAMEHAGSFTVAKAMELDILEQIRLHADRAIADGTTFETFHEELDPYLRYVATLDDRTRDRPSR